MSTKFIVVKMGGEEQIFTFPATIDHDRMLEAIGAIRMGPDHSWRREYRLSETISAGFVDGECHGKSMTLKIGSRADVDTALLNKALGVELATKEAK